MNVRMATLEASVFVDSVYAHNETSLRPVSHWYRVGCYQSSRGKADVRVGIHYKEDRGIRRPKAHTGTAIRSAIVSD
jgi:hypothetical protein